MEANARLKKNDWPEGKANSCVGVYHRLGRGARGFARSIPGESDGAGGHVTSCSLGGGPAFGRTFDLGQGQMAAHVFQEKPFLKKRQNQTLHATTLFFNQL